MMAAKGFQEVESLRGVDTNASFTEAYDRLFFSNNEYFRLNRTSEGVESGGVFNPFEYVYRDGDAQSYKSFMLEDYKRLKVR